MDTSYWNSIKSNIELQDTTKQFFGKYLWRLVITAHCGRLLLSKASLEDALDHRKTLTAHYKTNYSSWWNTRHNDGIDNVDLDLLHSVQQIKTHFGSRIRTRIEEPAIQFYATDELTLKQIASMLDNQDCIRSVTGPASIAEETMLLAGSILKRAPTEYSHKVILRDGRYGSDIKMQILSYLDSLGDAVKLSKSSRDMLTKPYASMWNVFFYTNDPQITTFLSLIEPTIISNIHKLIHVDYK